LHSVNNFNFETSVPTLPFVFSELRFKWKKYPETIR
jgi:hypothetical protein